MASGPYDWFSPGMKNVMGFMPDVLTRAFAPPVAQTPDTAPPTPPAQASPSQPAAGPAPFGAPLTSGAAQLDANAAADFQRRQAAQLMTALTGGGLDAIRGLGLQQGRELQDPRVPRQHYAGIFAGPLNATLDRNATTAGLPNARASFNTLNDPSIDALFSAAVPKPPYAGRPPSGRPNSVQQQPAADPVADAMKYLKIILGGMGG